MSGDLVFHSELKRTPTKYKFVHEHAEDGQVYRMTLFRGPVLRSELSKDDKKKAIKVL